MSTTSTVATPRRSTCSNHCSGVHSVWIDLDLLSLQVGFEDVENVRAIDNVFFDVVYLACYCIAQLLVSEWLGMNRVTKQCTRNSVEESETV